MEMLSQRDTRDQGVFEDQFGRPYLVTWEKKTGDPTGLIAHAHFPGNIPWDDPLRTPQKYLAIPKSKYGLKEVGKLVVNLDQFATDQADAMRAWTNFLWHNAEIEYPSQKPEPAAMERDPLLLRRTGAKPWPSPDIIRIAMRGVEDKLARQFLGLDPLGPEAKLMLGTPDPADALDTYLADRADGPPETYKEFVSWAFRTNQVTNLKEVGALWALRHAPAAKAG